MSYDRVYFIKVNPKQLELAAAMEAGVPNEFPTELQLCAHTVQMAIDLGRGIKRVRASPQRDIDPSAILELHFRTATKNKETQKMVSSIYDVAKNHELFKVHSSFSQSGVR